MLSAARASTKHVQAAAAFINFYSTVSGLTSRNWRTGGHPAPRPLTKQKSDDPFAEYLDLEEERNKTLKISLHNKPPATPTPSHVLAHRSKMREDFPNGWQPPKKLSREAMEGLRYMHATDPELFSTPVLADRFKISPEAVRRILKSKWMPTHEQRVKLAERERKSREDWIRKRREEERKCQRASYEGGRSVRRANKNDRLTLT